MSQEVVKRVLQESPKFLLPLSLLAVSLYSVSFLKSNHGFKIKKEEDLEKLSESEQRVALKLLGLGLDISFESIEIRLDKPVEVAGRNKKTGKARIKYVTNPDINAKICGVDCYLEIGSKRPNAHKRRQARVMERVVELKKNKRILYVQLFKKDIELIEESVGTEEELWEFLYKHELAIYTRQIALCFL